MRIDPKNKVDGVYDALIRKNTTESASVKHSESDLKRDRVELSQSAEGHDELKAAREEVLREVERGSSPDKLRGIKAKVDSGSYSVSSEDIADAMLGTDTQKA